MKKILSILILLSMLLCFAGCVEPQDSDPSDDGTTPGGDGTTPGDGSDTTPGDGNNGTAPTGEALSYLDDMSSYVTLDKSDYSDMRLASSIRRPTSADVENEIIKLIYSNRESQGTVVTAPSIPAVAPGHSVSIYYRGYYIEDGSRVYFNGGCNLPASSPSALGIGSGQFISGFELGLVGRIPSDYVSIKALSEGTVADGDIIIVSYDHVPYEGSATTQSGVVVDLSEDVDAIFGKGFRELVTGAELGKTGTGSIVVDNGGTSDVITSVKVEKIYRAARTDEDGEALPVLTVTSYFPFDYGKEELNGREAFFDVYIMSSTVHEAPEFDDAFVTDILKLTDADLEKYAGESLAEKYRAVIFERLNEEYDAKLRGELMSGVIEHIFERVEIVSLPESAILYQYNSLYNEILALHKQYIYYYPSIDSFARAYLGLEEGTDWTKELKEMASDGVIRQAAYYYVGQAEGFIPNSTELDAAATELYNAGLESFLKYYGIVREKFNTQSEYNAKVLEYSEYYAASYSMDYFRESAVVEAILDGIIKNFVTVI